ncbi:LysR family transcriptional regulator [Afifella marina]|uniref:DNA-binding transcriptional regulator, LysR family n=1 Tax=Afifella marina DSM 2698 TaxID=1120955 RepID=A0A1G5NPM0_AFIMA|nr:LysR family transcriptional regulator [Afifella marina]MBK1624512.1 LysR family transcriptional regulator [Afifella marina DSM 2698]MBK1627405.1 LysR family transcriptional regulator [Afifella marina]MBK5918463.1 hypothetical protein [Afifella marina]RAI20622.1 hypothetical protein CH311_09550 [Afifella marina DSM 2698]SCZ39353.1 DNA-binding transcriptional regulator, LysR family [Afifella marina DSM 2698]
MRIPRTTMEQWAVLQAVVENGGFAQAAERLNRSQSSVSYAVSRLQERLGVQLLQIEGRKARLTPAGRSLLAEANPLIDDLSRLEDRARSLGTEESQVRLRVDSIFPRQRLFGALQVFAEDHPHVEVELRESVRVPEPDRASDDFDLAISLWQPGRADQHPLIDIPMLAVADPGHPLVLRSGGAITPATLARHLRVAISGDGAVMASEGLSPSDGRTWDVNSLEAGVEAVLSGLCWGWLPEHLVAAHLAARRLVELDLVSGSRRVIPLALSWADETRTGKAALALGRLLLDGPDQVRLA